MWRSWSAEDLLLLPQHSSLPGVLLSDLTSTHIHTFQTSNFLSSSFAAYPPLLKFLRPETGTVLGCRFWYHYRLFHMYSSSCI